VQQQRIIAISAITALIAYPLFSSFRMPHCMIVVQSIGASLQNLAILRTFLESTYSFFQLI
jgi:hypothetical protein